jgi:hypothetical protein
MSKAHGRMAGVLAALSLWCAPAAGAGQLGHHTPLRTLHVEVRCEEGGEAREALLVGDTVPGRAPMKKPAQWNRSLTDPR